MAVVNIPRNVKDEFYRYKMPALVAKVEGRGNGVKTLIPNMVDISKSLERSPGHITKYFGFELGALTTIDPAKDRFIVNGKHDQSKLASVLDKFINDFLLCKQCKNPETKMLIRNDNIELKCAACGARSPVDMRHKITTYILKNPSDGGSAAGADDGKKSKKTKSSKKSKSKTASDDEGEGDDGAEEEHDEKPKPKTTPKKKKHASDDEEEVVWFTDTSKEAAEQRRRQMLDDTSELAAKLLIGDAPKENPLVRMQKFIAGNTKEDDIVAELHKLQEEQKYTDDQTAHLAFLALFDKDVLKQLKTSKTNVLKKVSPKGQRGVIDGIVDLASEEPEVLKSVPHVLKTLYDMDILEEDTIISWYDTKSKANGSKEANGKDIAAKVKDASKVFVDWLKTADEESEEEDSD